MKNLVVLSGAGISAESGLRTFRDGNGLWEEHRIDDVATPEAWARNPALVLRFYNERRQQLLQAKPNSAHIALKDLERYFNVHIITQNVDDLHERAGSKNVLHLHGELKKARSTIHPDYIVEAPKGLINLGDKCPWGGQLRPYVVWFGEDVPMLEPAAVLAEKADIFLIIGTSLNVYPAAGLLHYVPRSSLIYMIDPQFNQTEKRVIHIKEKATVGMQQLREMLIGAHAE